MPRKTKVAAAETTETTAIVLRIAADRTKDFEAMFQAEELPIWDDFTRRGRFHEARLVRATGGSEQRGDIQDYILHIVAADHEAHEEHDRDPRLRAGRRLCPAWSMPTATSPSLAARTGSSVVPILRKNCSRSRSTTETSWVARACAGPATSGPRSPWIPGMDGGGPSPSACGNGG